MNQRFELFVSSISKAYKQLQRIKKKGMEYFNLQGTQVMCIYYLGNSEEGLTVTELSELCVEDKAAVSRAISGLVEKGYTMIEAERKYRAQIMLTPEGQNISIQIAAMVENAVSAAGKNLKEEHREIFYNVLNQVSDKMEEYLEG